PLRRRARHRRGAAAGETGGAASACLLSTSPPACGPRADTRNKRETSRDAQHLQLLLTSAESSRLLWSLHDFHPHRADVVASFGSAAELRDGIQVVHWMPW